MTGNENGRTSGNGNGWTSGHENGWTSGNEMEGMTGHAHGELPVNTFGYGGGILPEDRSYELEMRIRNLVWTISGDYTLELKPNLDTFSRSQNIAVYDGVKQGGLAKYFDPDAISMYLLKKVYCHAEQSSLIETAQLCIEAAVGHRLDAEREGIRRLRQKAFEDVLDQDFSKLSGFPLGRLKIAAIRQALDGSYHATKQIREPLEVLNRLRDAEDSSDVIRAIDELYNTVVDPHFAEEKTLEDVLAVTVEELTEFSWKDLLDEDAADVSMQAYLEKLTEDMSSLENPAEPPQKKDPAEQGEMKKKILVVDEEALAKMYTYVERNFGRSYLSPAEQKSRTYQYCRGIHADSSLFYTEGILAAPVMRNNTYVIAQRQMRATVDAYKWNRTLVKRNIQILTDTLQKAFVLRNDEQIVRGDHGTIVPSRLWRVGRSKDAQLFDRRIENEASDFVVELLIDASGSQRKRQTHVALQAYIISEALSNLNIPFRVMSFCTFWDYTVLRRFRDYEDDRTMNRKLFEFTTSSNNRDGLAIRAAGSELLQRNEKNKIMIVLSDGKPNDVVMGRPNAKNPEPYTGRPAILDTGTEVRLLRQNDVAVLGVFVGDETELQAERKIFGKDFAYIRSIGSFSNTVGRYLLKQIEE